MSASPTARTAMNTLLCRCDPAKATQRVQGMHALMSPQHEGAVPTRMEDAVVSLSAVLGTIVAQAEPKQQHVLVIAIGALLGANVNAANLHAAATAAAGGHLGEAPPAGAAEAKTH